MVRQVKGDYQAREDQISLYLVHSKETLAKFKRYSLRKVPRSKNSQVDALAKLASTKDAKFLGTILVEVLDQPSVPKVVVMSVQERTSWMTPILDYLKHGNLPEEKGETRKIKYKATRYLIYDDILYRRGFNQPFLKCVDDKEGEYILGEIHEGVCENHAEGHSLASKVPRQGYYWPTMKKEAIKYARRCDKCQRFAKIPRNPPMSLTSITSPWPFAI